jgi:CheY-like chemotaxis protein
MEKQKILVVDDDKEILFSMSKLLEYECFEVWNAGDGLEALNALEKAAPDLIILDIMMPKLDGIAAFYEQSGTGIFGGGNL